MDLWFFLGIGAILAAGLFGGGTWLDWRVRGLPWPERRAIARRASGTFFMLTILFGAWLWWAFFKLLFLDW